VLPGPFPDRTEDPSRPGHDGTPTPYGTTVCDRVARR
jgi:hypothetical protein